MFYPGRFVKIIAVATLISSSNIRVYKSWQHLGPLLKVKLLVGYMSNPTKLKGAKGIRLTQGSGDSWMYPYQRTPMGNLYIPISWVFMGYYPQESLYKPYKYHGYTVRGTPVLVP